MNPTSKYQFAKYICSLGVFAMLWQVLFPVSAYALTEGPSQPEFKSFEPINATEMVNLFSGDFVYNLPIMEVPGPHGGYPINLAYHGGVTMEQEASIVGLGWNLNLGNIHRSMRGLPDDFKGDSVKNEYYIKPSRTVGVDIGAGSAPSELLGFPWAPLGNSNLFTPGLSLSLGAYYNNYKGIGVNTSITPSLGFAPQGFGANAAIGFSFNNQTGVGLNPSVSITNDYQNGVGFGMGANLSINSRTGLSSIGFSRTASLYGLTNGPSSVGKHFYNPFSTPVQIEMDGINKGLGATYGTAVKYGIPFFFKPFSFIGFSANVRGYEQVQQVRDEEKKSAGYGYLYTELGNNGQDPSNLGSDLLDFSRSNDRLVTYQSTHLAVPSFTHDYYQINGQGVGGTARLFRANHGVLFDKTTYNETTGFDYDVEIGVSFTPPLILPASGAHLGWDNYKAYSLTKTGAWDTELDEFSNQNAFTDQAASYPGFEPAYFQIQGEHTVDEFVDQPSQYEGTPERIQVVKQGQYFPGMANKFVAKDVMVDAWGGTRTNFFKNRPSRKSRNNLMSYLTKAETQEVGLSRYLYSQNQHAFPSLLENHHLGEITVLDPSGTRYVYGYPATNRLHREVSFAVAEQSFPDFGPDFLIDNSQVAQYAKKRNGVNDEFFQATEMGPYVNDYLLTAVVGNNYVDVDETAGPSEGDLGYWVRMDYRPYVFNYQWRAPYQGATYMPGARDDKPGEMADDKASYLYGKKDLVYLDEIYTATHKAVLHYSDRRDGFEANAETNFTDNRGTQTMLKLDSVSLYSLQDTLPDAVLMRAHFEYDYHLCPNVPNNDGLAELHPTSGVNLNAAVGKLSLRKVWFTYENSQKGALTPYEFNYSAVNPAYDESAHDRWGFYKIQPDGQVPTYHTESPHHHNNNIDYPFVDPFLPKSVADDWASAWNLSEIILPSGAKIAVGYEADDYAYVQNKRALEMLEIKQIGSSDPTVVNHDNNGLMSGEEILTLRLPEKVFSASEFFDQYLDGIDPKVYFKIMVKLNGTDGNKTFPVGFSGSDVYDYVSGYMELELVTPGSDYGVDVDGDGWIKVKTVSLSDESPDQVHPFFKGAAQHTRLQRSDINFRPVQPGDPTLTAISNIVTGMFQEFPNLFQNYNRVAMKRNGCQSLKLEKSFVRLGSSHRPGNKTGGFGRSKLGGGHRVKWVKLIDDWVWKRDGGNPLTQQSEYGQEYEYTIEEGGKTISSGVAANEPNIGLEESPLKSYLQGSTEVLPLHVDNELFTETPMMLPYYPGEQVGYRKVRVTSINQSSADETRTGLTETEFYTAKDFPVLESATPIDPHPTQNPISIPFFGTRSRSELALSQGYYVQLNDMHGKLKRETQYRENVPDDIISQTEYVYHTTPSGRLNNTINVLTNDGEVSSAVVGREIEEFSTMRQTSSYSYNGRDPNEGLSGIIAQYNMDLYITPPFLIPILLPSIWPHLDRDITALRTATTVKVEQRYGILKEVRQRYMQANSLTTHHLHDAATGEPLLSSTTNEFEEPVYTYQYAAHWAYPGMEAAYQNIGYEQEVNTYVNDAIKGITEVEAAMFTPGDELLVNESGGYVLTVKSVEEIGFNNWDVICYQNVTPINGATLPASPFSVKVIRSGHRNLQATKSGKVVSLETENILGLNGAWVLSIIINQMLADDYPFSSPNNLWYEMNSGQPNYGDYASLFDLMNLYTNTSVSGVRLAFDNNLANFLVTVIFGQEQCKFLVNSLAYNGSTQTWNFVYIPGGQGVLEEYQIFADGNTYSVDIADFELNCPDLFIEQFMGVLHADASTFTDDWPLDFADGNAQGIADLQAQTENPYQSGEKGIHRIHEAYAYRENRNQLSLDVSEKHPELRSQGVYAAFTPFSWDPAIPNVANWVFTSQLTRVSSQGFELESNNALNIPSAVVYGYDQHLPIMRGVNTRYLELANANFEEVLDYPLTNTLNGGTTYDNHFGHFFIANATSAISSEDAYTGTYSLSFSGSNNSPQLETVVNGQVTTDLVAEKEYLVSMWVKDKAAIKPTEVSATIRVEGAGGCSNSLSFQPSGPVLEGWQKIEGKISLPSACNTGFLQITLDCPGSSAYVDDVRLMPWEAQVTTYVYDPINHRFLASLDDNNYAARYYYDEEGQLTHVMKDTEDGIRLIQEGSTNVAH